MKLRMPPPELWVRLTPRQQKHLEAIVFSRELGVHFPLTYITDASRN